MDKDFSPNFKKFYDWSQSYLQKHNKKSTIANSKTVPLGEMKVGGWCDGEEIMIARKNSLFEETYVHEFSHMQQSIEGSPLWKESSVFWADLERELVPISSWESVMDSIALERDCERRSLLHSKKWNLFDNKEYSRAANLYLYFYHYVFLKSKWVKSVRIYHPFILAEMPEKLVALEKFNTIDMKLMQLFDDCLDKNGKFYKMHHT